MLLRRASILLGLAVLLAVGVALLLIPGTRPTPPRTPTTAELAQARADALAAVAQHIYYQEVFGSPNSSAFSQVAALPGLVAGLEHHDLPLARRALRAVSFGHVVRVRVTRGRRVRVDVGLDFVIAGQRRPLHAPDGTYLGRIEVSIQDVIGLIKLFHRLTGADIVVRGGPGQAKSAPRALRLYPLPSSGAAAVAGHRFVVSSFRRLGFAGGPLEVWVLLPDS